MNAWKQCKLGDVIELIGGGTPKTIVADYWNGNIPWLSVADFNTGNKYVYNTEKTITEKGLKNSSTKLLSEGDIIISARGTIGALAVLKKQMTFNQSCYGIRCIPQETDQEYIYYLTKYSINNLKQIAHGGVFDTITRETFDQIEVELPPRPEQRAIAGVLSSLDDKIDLLHRQNKTLEGMAEALWRKMFMEETEKKNDNGKLGDVVASANTGLDAIKRAPIVEKDTGIKCLRIQDVSQSKTFDRWGFTEVSEQNFVKFQLRKDDIIMARTCSPGINYFVREDLKAVFNNGLVRIRADKSKVYPIFLYNLFKTREFIGHIDGISGGTSVQLNMQVGELLDYNISFPSIAYQEKILGQFVSIDNKIFKNHKQSRTLSRLRDTLLPKLMNGEMRVKA